MKIRVLEMLNIVVKLVSFILQNIFCVICLVFRSPFVNERLFNIKLVED